MAYLLLFIIRVKRELKRVYRNGCRYYERLNVETGGSKTPRTTGFVRSSTNWKRKNPETDAASFIGYTRTDAAVARIFTRARTAVHASNR
jgi:hypothetical protein